METLARTIFLTSISSFLVFLIADLLRPGFVSNYFSVHWILLVAVGSGLWWAIGKRNGEDRPVFQIVVAFFLGMALAMVAWRIGEGFGEYIFLVVVVAFLTPQCILHLIRSST